VLTLNSGLKSDLGRVNQGRSGSVSKPVDPPSQIRNAESAIIRIRLGESNPSARLEGDQEQGAKISYFVGSEEEKWRDVKATPARSRRLLHPLVPTQVIVTKQP